MKENSIPPSQMPERFLLEKDDLSLIFKSVRKHWNRSELSSGQNAIYSSAMVTVSTTIDIPFVSIITLKNIYFSVIQAVRQIETLNAMKISVEDASEKDKQNFQSLLDIQYEKIKNGEAFNG